MFAKDWSQPSQVGYFFKNVFHFYHTIKISPGLYGEPIIINKNVMN